MILLRKRGGVWHAEANLNGERKRWSLKTRDRQVAEQLRRQAELELLGGGSLVPKRWPEFRTEFHFVGAAARAPTDRKEL